MCKIIIIMFCDRMDRMDTNEVKDDKIDTCNND